MALIKFNDNPSDRDLRQFAAIWFPLFWVAVASILYYNTRSIGPSLAIVVAAVVIGAIGAVHVAFIRPVFLGWMVAAYPIGWLVSHTLLAIIYYAVITPVGVLMRLGGYDPMNRSLDRNAPTYWQPVEPIRDPRRYFRQL